MADRLEPLPYSLEEQGIPVDEEPAWSAWAVMNIDYHQGRDDSMQMDLLGLVYYLEVRVPHAG